MRVLGVLAVWGVLAVLATMCFALGGSIGYRRGVRDTLAQVRDRRSGKAGCRPLPATAMRRRSSGHLRPGARARRARWAFGPSAGHVTAGDRTPSRLVPALAACLAGLLLIGVPVTAAGASTAAPGDRLYPAKRALEQLRLVTAVGAKRNAQAHLDIARTRVAELALVGDGDPDVVAELVGEVAAHSHAVSQEAAMLPAAAERSELQQDLALVLDGQDDLVTDLRRATCAAGADGDCIALREVSGEVRELHVTAGGAAVATASEMPSKAAIEGRERKESGEQDAEVADATSPKDGGAKGGGSGGKKADGSGGAKDGGATGDDATTASGGSKAGAGTKDGGAGSSGSGGSSSSGGQDATTSGGADAGESGNGTTTAPGPTGGEDDGASDDGGSQPAPAPSTSSSASPTPDPQPEADAGSGNTAADGGIPDGL